MSQPIAKATILIVDDERLIRLTLREHLADQGYEILEAASGANALEQLATGVDLILLDYRLPDVDGLSLLTTMRKEVPDVPVVMLTAHSTVEQSVEAMRRGAFHYASKPFDLAEVTLTIQRALETTRLRREVRALRATRETGLDDLLGRSAAMADVRALVKKIAQSPASTVLITGESGTGKGMVAKAIHDASDRASGPFLNVTCSALAPSLIESELFGHERGAFTDAKSRKEGLFEQAQGGTVFLDEIGEVELQVQAKLLRFLEEKTFRRVGGTLDLRGNVRIIAATNVDLREAVKHRAFREDLYYRLAVFTIPMPALRDREGDIGLLCKAFVDRFNGEFNKDVASISDAALRRLTAYAWPGNVRELRNAVERAVLLADGTTLDLNDFNMLLPPTDVDPAAPFTLPPAGVDLRALEQSLVEQALARTRGNQTQAAALLGINRDQIRYRIDKFGIVAKPDEPT